MCGVRGSKCLCCRPSLALEHIFFLEERKNKFGARNFSHVSDTMMTSSSTMFTNSTNGADPSSNFHNATVVMRSAGSFVNSEVNPTDYYCQNVPPPSNVSDSNDEFLIPCLDNKTEMQLCPNNPNQSRSSKISATTDVSPTTLVRNGSRRMMSKARHDRNNNMQSPITEVMTGEYILYTEDNIPVALPHRHRHQQKQIGSHNWRQVRASNTSANVAHTCLQHKGKSGVSFQFCGRSGSGVSASSVSTLMLSNKSMSSCSTNESSMIGSSSISSMQYLDRVSLETNFGSLNLQSNLSNRGRLIESGYALGIKENDEARALEKLTGWFHASSVSTQDSLMMSRS